MNIVSIVITLIVFVVVACLLEWFLRKMNPSEPVRYIVYGAIAIIGILVVAGMAGMGPGVVIFR